MSEQDAQNNVELPPDSQGETNADKNDQEQESEVKILPLEDLKKLFSRVKDSMLRSSTSTEALQEACSLINVLSAKALAQENPLTEEQTKFFYEEFFKEIGQRTVNAETTHGPTQDAIADLLRELVDLLVSELKAQTPTCLSLVEKLRQIFDPTKHFHKNAFQSVQAQSTGQVQSSGGDVDQENLSQDDLKWRQSLQVGTTIDAIKIDTKHHLQGWAKGEITAVNGTTRDLTTRNLTIKWYKDVGAVEGRYSALDSSIAPYGTKTSDDRWRVEIQKGDLVDAIDKYGNWSTGTVITLDPRKIENADMPMIKIGFRQYDPNGDKSDSTGSYFGYSENLDEFLGQYSLRIQKPNSQTTLKDLAGNSVKMDEVAIAKLKARGGYGGSTLISENERRQQQDKKDMEMIEQEGQVIVAVERDSCRSQLLIELLVRFADTDGFESLLGVLAKPETSLQSVKDLLTLICGGTGAVNLYHKTFVDKIFEQIKDVVEAKLLSADEKLLRATQFSTFEESVDLVWLTLMKRAQSEQEIQIGKYQLLTKLGILFFEQSFMQKRIDGAIAINQVCNKALTMGAMPSTEIKEKGIQVVPTLLKTLQDAKIINLYFDRSNIHNQLVQRAEGVLGLFLSQEALSDEDLDMIWSNCLAEDAIYRNLIASLSNLDTSAMKPAQMSKVIDRVMKVPKSKIRQDEIDLLQLLCYNNLASVKEEDEPLVKINQAIVIEFYVDFLTQEDADKYLNKVIANKAIFNLMDVLKASPDEVIDANFDKIVDNMRNKKATFVSLKIAHRFFKERKVTHKSTLPELAEKLEQKHDFMQLVIDELKDYSAMVNAKLAEEIKEAEALETKLPDETKYHESTYDSCFAHNEQVSERIDFLTLFNQECAKKLSKQHLAGLWVALVERNMVKFDKKQVFSMLKDFINIAISNEKNNVISLEDLCSFYRETIVNGLTDFTSLEMEGFICIQGFFVLINSGEGRLKIIDDTQAAGGTETKSILKNSGSGTSGNKVTSISSDGVQKKQNLNFNSTTTTIDTTDSGTSGAVYGPQPPPPKTSATTGTQAGSGATTTATTKKTKLEEGSVQIISKTAPSEMEGLAGLWQIAKQAENAKVSEAAIEILIKVHTQLDDSLMESLSSFEDLYMKSCVAIIQEQLIVIGERTEEQKLAASKAMTTADKKIHCVEEKFISNAIRCLTRLIQNSEREGTFGLTSHRSFAQGTLLSNITISNCVNYAKGNGYQETFSLNLKSNLNMYQLKKLICKQLAFKKSENIQEEPLHPASVKLIVNRYLDRPVKDFENGLLLQEIFLKNADKISVYPRGNEDLLTANLIEPGSDNLTARVKDAVKQLFDKFAIESDQIPGLFYLGTDQVKKLIDEVTKETKHKPSAILAYNTSEDADKVLFEDFVNYYKAMAKEKPDLVRDNLSFVGLRADMRPVPKSGDSEHCLILHKKPTDMPRFKVSNNEEIFKTLLSCLDLHQDTRKDANELLLQACTNQRILQDVLHVRSAQFDVDSLDSDANTSDFVYTLSMVEQILYNSSESDDNVKVLNDDSAKEQEELKNTWVPRFLRSGGLDKLTQMMEKVLKALVAGRASGNMKTQVIQKYKEILSVTMKIVKVFITATVCSLKNDANAEVFSIKQTPSALSKRLQQGMITAIVSNKFLRRADKEEDELEEKLLKAVSARSTAVSFFGVPIKQVANAIQKSATSQQNQSSASKTKSDLNDTEQITEDFLFGQNDLGSAAQTTGEAAESGEEKPAALEQPPLKKVQSLETKSNERERIFLIDVTQRFKQIAQQIAEAMSDPTFEINLDFDLIEDFCLEAVCTFMFSTDKELAFEKTLIKEAFEVWVACIIRSNKPLTWERKPENINERTRIRNMEDLIKEAITCSLIPDVRRFWLQTLSLACEQLSRGNNREPYRVVITTILKYLSTIDYSQRIKLSEELYELLGDSCFFLYYMEREMTQSEIEFEPIGPQIYKEVTISLIEALKAHDSFNEENEVLARAKALESLLFALADVFSFFNKGESYEIVQSLLHEHQLIEYIFYEVLFFVPGKTQCVNRYKAKRLETRKAAFQLMFKLIKFLKPADVVPFLQELLTPMIVQTPRPISWSHQPSDKVRRATEQAGIRNLGNVCYMISMLQQFFMVPSFRYELLKVKDDTPENIAEHKERKFDDNMLRQLQRLFGFLEMTERAFVDPTEFCYSFKQWDGRPTNTGEQRDAQEFLNEFFDKLENQLKPTSQRFLLADTFQGSIVEQRKCGSCGHASSKIDPFYTQTLNVKDRQDVYESLAKQVEGEVIQDFRCDACKELVNLRSKKLLGKLPNVLIFHLQRIDFDFNTYQNKKLNDRYEFPNILELQKYSYKENVSEEEKAKPLGEEFEELLDYDDDEFVYRLVGVNIHRGAAGAGHYWSLIHTQRGEKEPDPKTELDKWMDTSKDWREFNDETVSYFFSKNIVEQGYGGYLNEQEMRIYQTGANNDFGKSAYMLVYEKKLKSELRQIKIGDEGSETVEKVPFNSVKREIPDWIEEQVTQDNRACVSDSQVFHPLFFGFTTTLLKYCTASLLDQEDESSPRSKPAFSQLRKNIFEASHKLSFDLLSHFKDIEATKQVCSSLRSVFSWSDPVSEFGLKSESLLLTFIREVLHKDKCEYFFKIMHDSHALKDIRDQIGRTVSRVIIKAIKIVVLCKEDPQKKDLPLVKELETLVDEVVKQLFDVMKSRQFQSKWSYLREYFEMLSDIIIEERYQTRYLLDKFDDLVTDLCDFMLQQKSPKALTEEDPRVEMGGSTNKPCFGPLVASAGHLIRCQWTPNSSEDCSTFAKKFTKDKQAKPENLISERIDISAEAIQYFTNADLFSMVMSQGYDVLDYSKGLAHVCWANKKLSKKVCKMAVKARNEGNRPNYLIVLRQLLKLQDRDSETGELLQPLRCEWVFGSAQPRYSIDDMGVLKLGLSSLSFNIHSDAVSYVTAITSKEYEQVSLLKHMIKQYKADQMAADVDQGVIQFKADAETAEDSPCKLTLKPVQCENEGSGDIQKSSIEEQLRSQGMSEEMIQQMTAAAGETPSKSRPKSADGTTSKSTVTADLKVDKYLNLESLVYFMKIVTADEFCMQFFSRLPGFTYQYARYTDWIGQYILSLSKVDQVDSKALTKDQKQDLKSLQTNYACYESYLASLSSDGAQAVESGNPEDVAMIDTKAIEENLRKGNPMPYMILKMDGQETDAGITIESGNIKLTASQIKCSFVPSLPTLSTNEAVSSSFLTKFGPQSSSKKASASASTQAAKAEESKENESDSKTGGTQAGTSAFAEPATMDDLKVNLEDPAVQYALSLMIIDPEFQWIFEFPEDEKLQCLENMVKDSVFKHVKEYYKQNSSASPSLAAPDANKEDQKPVEPPQAAQSVSEAAMDESNDPFAEWDGAPIESCDDLVYRLKLTNTGETAMKYRIFFEEGQVDTKSCLMWPLAGLTGSIGPSQIDKTVALLAKKEAGAEKGGLNELQKLQIVLSGTADERVAANEAKAADKNNNGGNGGTDASRHDQSVGGDLAEQFFDIPGEKQCLACTSFNTIDATECCVCLTKFQN